MPPSRMLALLLSTYFHCILVLLSPHLPLSTGNHELQRQPSLIHWEWGRWDSYSSRRDWEWGWGLRNHCYWWESNTENADWVRTCTHSHHCYSSSCHLGYSSRSTSSPPSWLPIMTSPLPYTYTAMATTSDMEYGTTWNTRHQLWLWVWGLLQLLLLLLWLWDATGTPSQGHHVSHSSQSQLPYGSVRLPDPRFLANTNIPH